MSEKKGILDGVRVIEAATMVMVPAVGAILAEFGAEVIKIEPPEGDMNRRGHHIPGMPDSDVEYTFLPDNRNKKSIVLDLKSEEGMDILRQLIAGADVFLTNHRRKAIDRLNITYEKLKALNPRLIYAHGTGFGDQGAEADKAGFDTVCYWARSGLEGHMFPLEGWPGSMAYGAGDHPSGMSLFGAVMLALFAREKSGHGYRVSSSLLANGAWSNSIFIQAKLSNATFHPKRRREDAYNFTGVHYRTEDNRLLRMAIVNVEQGWPRVCRAVGRPDLIDDPHYAVMAERRKHMSELISLLDDIFASHDVEYWKKTLEDHDVPFSIIATYDEVIQDKQMEANNVFVDFDDPQFGRMRSVGSPIEIDGNGKAPPTTAPRVGEHSREILEEYGFNPAEIDSLLERGVVKGK